MDGRNFVKKALLWALRAIAGRSPELYSAVIERAEELAERKEATPRWLGKATLRELRSAASLKRLERQVR
jgi:3-methyladenine DNA glycosylase AlkD